MTTAIALPVSALTPDTTRVPNEVDTSLDLRFDLGEVDERITFTRASTRTCQGPLGLIDEVVSDAPAIDYDPVTLHASTTALTVGLGAKNLTVSGGPGFAVGDTVRLTSKSDPTKWMVGMVLRYSAGAMRVAVLRYNGSGSASDWAVIAPLGLSVWEQRTNLLTYSEQFQDASWTKIRSFITADALVAPDGALTGDKLTSDATGTGFQVQKTGITISGTTQTQSIFLKKGSLDYAAIVVWDSSSNGVRQWFNLNTKTVASSNTFGSGWTKAAASIEDAGGGWLRCTLTANSTGASGGVIIYPSLSSDLGLGYSIGDYGYLWGAQLEAGSFPTPYIPTKASFTSRSSTKTYFNASGVLSTAAVNEAAYGYGLVNGAWVSKGLELEAAATNLAYPSNDSTTQVSPLRATFIDSGQLFIDASSPFYKLQEDTTASSTHLGTVTSRSVAANTTYTASYFVKAAGRSIVQLHAHGAASWSPASPVVEYDLVSKTATTRSGSASGRIEDVGNGVFRISITATTGGASFSSGFYPVMCSAPNTSSYTGDGASGILIGGYQLETGPIATSHIPTTTAAVTRAADVSSSSTVTRAADVAVMTGSNFSSWFNATEGAFVVDAIQPPASAFFMYAGDGTNSNRILIGRDAALNNSAYVTISGTNVVGLVKGANPPAVGTKLTLAFAYKADDFAFVRDGDAPSTDSAGGLPTVSQMWIGRTPTAFLNSHVSRLRFHTVRRSNSNLQALSA